MWVAEQYYLILGTRFRLEFTDDGPARALERLLAPFRLPDRVPVRSRNIYSLAAREGEGDLNLVLYRGCGSIGFSTSWDPLVARVLTEVNAAAVEQTRLLAVHSGVVSSNGAAIALPAESGAGKSTLTAACVQQGFGYVSDEALCVARDTGHVIPYPKPIELLGWSRETLGLEQGEGISDGERKRAFTARDLGSSHETSELELGHVVIPERSGGSARINELPRSASVGSLLSLSFNMYKQPEESFRLVGLLANQARAWKLEFEDPIEAARVLRRALA